MYLLYNDPQGQAVEVALTDRCPLTIGRSREADIVLPEEHASRLHCGIHYEDGAYILKDFKSKNGTYVNGERVESHVLHQGDRLRVGTVTIHVNETRGKSPDSALREVQQAMNEGKGYGTIMRDLVGEGEKPPSKNPPPPPSRA